MRLAAYNVENLFARARAMNLARWQDGRPILEGFEKLNALLQEATYTPAIKAEILRLLKVLGLEKSDGAEFVRLRRNRGSLVTRRKNGTVEVTANGRADWEGWIELEREPVDGTARMLTARALAELEADVIGIVEAESRPVLKDFADRMLPAAGGAPYAHVMLIDGNDARGIDCALMTRAFYPITAMTSHVDDADAAGIIFSRDCPVFMVRTPRENTLVVLVNHLKSKGFGSQADSNRKRERQARRIAAIYNALTDAGHAHIAVLGDFNDTPDSAALAPLLAGTDLVDVARLPGHEDGGFPGTYAGSGPSGKIDYILLSPALRAKAGRSGIFRKGMWPGVRPRKWETFPELDPRQGGLEQNAASDHGAVWVDLEV